MYQRAEAFEQYLRDLDARAPLKTANFMQEKLEHKHAPVDSRDNGPQIQRGLLFPLAAIVKSGKQVDTTKMPLSQVLSQLEANKVLYYKAGIKI